MPVGSQPRLVEPVRVGVQSTNISLNVLLSISHLRRFRETVHNKNECLHFLGRCADLSQKYLSTLQTDPYSLILLPN